MWKKLLLSIHISCKVSLKRPQWSWQRELSSEGAVPGLPLVPGTGDAPVYGSVSVVQQQGRFFESKSCAKQVLCDPYKVLLRSRRCHQTLHFEGDKWHFREGGRFCTQSLGDDKGTQTPVLVHDHRAPLPLQTCASLWHTKYRCVKNVVKGINHVNKYRLNVLPDTFFPNFKFCQTAWLTMRKTLPSVSCYYVNLLICLSAWAPLEKSWKSWITICCSMNAMDSAFALSMHEGQWTMGTCRWDLTHRVWTCPSFSIFCHDALSRKVMGREGETRFQLPASPLCGRIADRINQIRYLWLNGWLSEGLNKWQNAPHIKTRANWIYSPLLLMQRAL